MHSTKYSVSDAGVDEEELTHELPNTIRIEDLSPFIRMAQRYSPRRQPLFSTVILLVGNFWTLLGAAHFADSLQVGISFYALLSLVFLERLFSVPDSSSGLMLQQLLTNKDATSKGSMRYQAMWYKVGVGSLVMLISYWIFGLIPFANSSKQYFGTHTFLITIIVGVLSSFCFGFVCVFFANTMCYAISRMVWEHRIETYLLRIREILLKVAVKGKDIESHDYQDDYNASVFNEISNVQNEAETWARTIGVPLSSTTNTCAIISFSSLVVSCLVSLGITSGNITAVVIFSFSSLFFTFFFIKILKGIANINMLWESKRLEYFNDARIQHSLILLNWTPERFKDFMNSHRINSQVAFGIRITEERMRRIASVVGSVFAIVLYFLLREEVRVLAGTTSL